ncbi:CDP-alcohol phosphatidyltransferase family protein [Profundibacter sp.]|uniref:CDP-alcohol phosphatidyltransferase family protein n=1 Tax=Profundibacter sp. TaxID=3101071 RepID=UPI003D11E050
MNVPEAKKVPFRRFIPNFVTIFGLIAGLTAVRSGISGHFTSALYLLLLAMLLDAVDGKLARMLESTSQFGAELDTLADFFNFGVAPTIILYAMFFAGTPYANFGWLALIIYTIACMMRLARFNVALLEDDDEPVDQRFFVGVPAPALACLGFLPAFLLLMGWDGVATHPVIVALYIIFAGGLAVSRIPTYSIKKLTIPQERQFILFAGVVLFLIVLTVFPWHVLALVDLAYLVSLPLSYRAAKRG